MSYDIRLTDPVTGKTLQTEEPHFMRGGTYAIDGTTDLWLNITYNYSHYYYEVTDKDPRFAHEEVTAYHADGTVGPTETQYGIRGIYGKSGADSIPMLEDMIKRIKEKYRIKGDWISTERTKYRYITPDGEKHDDPLDLLYKGIKYDRIEYQVTINEGDTEDYWEATAANAIRPLYQLIAIAKMRPDGVWDGD